MSEGTVRGLHHRCCSGVHELIEARDERRLLNLQRRLARLKLLIIDELGFVPLSKTGAELLFEVFSQRYERGSVLYQALETKQLPIEVLSPRILSLKSRQDQLTAARDEAEGQLEQRRADLPTSKEIKGYVADFREFLQEGTFPERKALIRNFVQGIEIENRGRADVTPSDGMGIVYVSTASVLDFVQSGPPERA